jgi:hypothetical protein
MYAEGTLHVNAGLGAGSMYKIKSHPAANANATLAVELYDALLSNLASANSKASLVYNPCDGVIIHPSPPTTRLVGNPLFTVTANYYFWAQKRGPSPVDTDGTLVVGQTCFPSTGEDGTVQPSSGNAIDMIKLPIVGEVMNVNANDAWSLINLKL